MKNIFIAIMLYCPLMLVAQDYNVALIPDSLLKDANVVKRYDELRVSVKGIDKAVIRRKYAFTVLNESGEYHAVYVGRYDKLRSLSDISGRMFDASGKLLKSIHKKDIADLAVSDGESMISDGRTKSFAFYNKSYPYTVEFEDEVTYDGILGLPGWYPISGHKQSVQQSTFIVETPTDYHLRFKAFNYFSEPIVTTSGKTIGYRWELKNLTSIIPERDAPDWQDITPVVYIAPTDFELAGYKGNMTNWNEFGKFLNQLYAGRDVLPDHTRQDVHRIVDGLKTKEEKVFALYSYLQKNTRYVGVQLGIGGWQPFEAKYVAEKKYGDCKALSNYMVSLLKEAGIPANCVTIESGRWSRGLIEDFSFNQFDHVIACVPGPKDTIWLECTSQTVSPGYMGDFTGNRKALLISDKGGYVVHTPNYTSEDNLQIRKVGASIDDNGNLMADVQTRFTGIQQDGPHELMYDWNKEQREKYLNTELNLPTYKVEKNDYQEVRGKIPAISEYLKISSENYASVTGKRMFVAPDLFNKEERLPTDRARKYPIDIRYSFKDIDTIILKVPSGYSPEAAPKDVSLSNKFGRYSITYKISGNIITLVRINEHYAGIFAASEYDDLVKFYDAMYKADRSRFVLVKSS